MRTHRGLRLSAGLVAAAMLLTACGQDSGDDGGSTSGASGGGFSVYVCEPEHLVPQNTNETCGAEVLNALFTPLVNFDPETSDPLWGEDSDDAVAASVESEDQQNWTITLKEGWTFHNGEPVDAASYVRAWNAGAYSPNAYGNSYFFENIVGYDDLQAPEGGGEPKATEMSGLKVVDDQTFTVELKAPFSQFPLTIGYTAFYPLPKAYEDDPKAFEEQPIGNGPFQMDGSWEHNQQIKVKRYENYGGEAAKADEVTFAIYSDVNTAYNDLLAGNLDVMDAVPPERIADAKAQFGDRFIERPSSSFTYVGYPLYDPAFQDVRLRKAISMAIDREAIIKAIFNGSFTPAKSLVSPVVAGSRGDPCGEACSYNPEKAKELFDAAGGYDGTLTLWFNSGAGHEAWMESVSNQLRSNLGIENIKFKSLEFAEYLALLDAEKVTGPFRLGWVMDYPSPQNYLEPIYSTSGSSNNFGYSNKKVDALIEKGNAAETVEAGIEFYQQAEDLILADMPNIPMWFGQVQAAHTENVENVVIDAFTRVNVSDIEVVG
ncbi:peptide ABC transporter substrate-binding protein [Nocardioides mesophilus]|uniref:ABC transporter substrate-binding protein n=1 Tax=Nocardioides mesophilus TaxID=433659 RepID=A0A7G9RE05_9ACTN|nr:ABC transporter substrate-binding protein [Nocardioides mesophilus]QNN53830.1 ABC transporter substrate-binding protein [Nocardioides mesophilus]